MKKTFRLITVSGLGLTGTSTLSLTLAKALGWRSLLIGERFRDYARERNIPLASIPEQAHMEFDRVVQDELLTLNKVVLDGRYLGFLGAVADDILRIGLISPLEVRVNRAKGRYGAESDLRILNERLLERDLQELRVFQKLYGNNEFLNANLFHMVLKNDDSTQMEDLVACVVAYLGLRIG